RRSSRPEARSTSGGRALAIYAAALAVAVAPLLIGGGPPWAQVVSVALAFGAAALFLIARGFTARTVPFAAVAALGVAITAFQLVPLPAALVRLLSPRALELRTEAAGGLAPWFLPLTVDVPATLIESTKAMALLALLLVVGN